LPTLLPAYTHRIVATRMITVLHLITGLDTGGAEITLYRLVAHSDNARFRHVVVSLIEPGPVGRQIAALGIPVHSLHMRRGMPDPRGVSRLRAELQRTMPDVIQTWMYHANLLGLLGAAFLRVPVAWKICSMLPDDLSRKTAMVGRAGAWLSSFPEAVVTNSEPVKTRHIQLGYRPKEWLVIPNGFDVAQFAPDAAARQSVRRELGLQDDVLLIGLFARFHPVKDHRTFIRAAGLLAAGRPEVHFVLAGTNVVADNETLRSAIAVSGAHGRMHLLGERADIPRLTAALDIASCSSSSESFSNVVGEAMSCAVPCVVTNVGDLAHVVGDTGRIVPARDATAMAAAWAEFVDLGPAGRQETGWRARERVVTLFSLDNAVRGYEAMYERLAR
jgi:glycosyltransferase involved in cell wall biosynthesis